MRIIYREGMNTVMKSIKIGLIVALSIVTISLCGIFAYGMAGGDVFRRDRRQSYNNVQLVLEKEIPLEGIDSISILYGMNSNDVYLLESEKDAITVREYSSSELSEKELSTVKADGNCVEIRGARRNDGRFGFFWFGNGGSYNRHYTEVYLPASYQGEFLLETSSGDIVSELAVRSEKDVSITSSSGDVEFPSVAAENVSVNTSSGYVKVEDIHAGTDSSAGEINIGTSSGDVDVKELTGRTDIECSSGNVTAKTITGDAQLKTSSGDINIEELTGEAETECSSGYLSIGTLTGNAQFKTTSGDVEVQYADGDVQTSTSSGSVMISEGSGDRRISTTSGSIMAGSTEGSFQVSTQSGEVQITVQKGEGSIETTSGDIQLSLEELAGTLNINSSSGYVSVTLSEENKFELAVSTTSGDIRTFFDNDLTFSSRRNNAQGIHGGNEGNNHIEIQTTSGDVEISKY